MGTAPVWFSWMIIFFILGFFLIFFIIAWKVVRDIQKAFNRSFIMPRDTAVALAAIKSSEDPEVLRRHLGEVFLSFQRAWSSFDLAALPALLTTTLFPRIALELGVLKQLGRRNEMKNVEIKNISFLEYGASSDGQGSACIAAITASAQDRLVALKEGRVLFEDESTFTEYWEFRRQQNRWKLYAIRQETESAEKLNPSIKKFAATHDFFYDPDFGRLLLPSGGILFSQGDFAEADINNHVIGEYKKTIIEFYSYTPPSSLVNYVVAQAILPKTYANILVQRLDSKMESLDPEKKMRKIKLESNDFNKKFILWSDRADYTSALELLTPNFMERISRLTFEINIEIIGEVLYLYTEEHRNIGYDDLLEVLHWAFEEMKM